jgi:hypothetical protein
MTKPLEKKNIRSAQYGVKVLFDHPAQHSVGNLEDKKADPAEIRIAQLITCVDQIKQAQTDGYWSVLREL